VPAARCGCQPRRQITHTSHTCTLRKHPHSQQFPSAASERQGHGGHELNTLEDELNRFLLEKQLDRTLQELRRKKEAAAAGTK
jgi:hypothetical protein